MLDERFWSKVDTTTPSGCWEWTAYRNPKGYGRFQTGTAEGPRFAHRLSFEAAKGRIPAGKMVLHKCDNPRCVNPDHLWLGDNKANMADCKKKGRYYRDGPLRPRGEKHGRSKGTTKSIIAIRRAYISGTSLDEIARRFSVKPTFVQDVVYGRVWRHLFGVDGSPTLEELEAARRPTPSAKINQTIADEIRVRLAAGALGVDLASEYGVHKATISDIRRGKIWAARS